MTNGFIICNLRELILERVKFTPGFCEIQANSVRAGFKEFLVGGNDFVRTKIQDDAVVRKIEYRENQAKIRESRSQHKT